MTGTQKTVNIKIAPTDLTFLKDNKYRLCFAKKVNDTYDVVGQSYDEDLATNSFMWTPVFQLFGTNECVGIHAAKIGTRFEPLEPIRQGVRQRFGELSVKRALGLGVRHDWGSQYTSEDFQRELDFLGIVSSPSFVRSPESNGIAERFIRTLKEQLLWVKTFHTVDFQTPYNQHWILERHGYRTPSNVRKNLLDARAA